MHNFICFYIFWQELFFLTLFIPLYLNFKILFFYNNKEKNV